jgi:hypothetical protein
MCLNYNPQGCIWSELSKMKNRILSSLSSQTVSNSVEVFYKPQWNYSCRRTVPALPPGKKENTSIFSTSAQFILFLLYSTYSNQPKNKNWAMLFNQRCQTRRQEFCCLFLQIQFIRDFDKVWDCWRTVKSYKQIFFITSDHHLSNAQDQCAYLCHTVRCLNLIHHVERADHCTCVQQASV